MRYLTNLWVHMVLKFPKLLFGNPIVGFFWMRYFSGHFTPNPFPPQYNLIKCLIGYGVNSCLAKHGHYKRYLLYILLPFPEGAARGAGAAPSVARRPIVSRTDLLLRAAVGAAGLHFVDHEQGAGAPGELIQLSS